MHINVKKQLVKSPKIYFQDTAKLHYLLAIKNCINTSRDEILKRWV
jgi:predicted AAA+ superfamily ATPase